MQRRTRDHGLGAPSLPHSSPWPVPAVRRAARRRRQVSAPSSSILTGKFVWHDLVTQDPEACRRFYGELLGWEFGPWPRRAALVVARSGGQLRRRHRRGASGCEPGPAQWLAYMAVPDVDEAVGHRWRRRAAGPSSLHARSGRSAGRRWSSTRRERPWASCGGPPAIRPTSPAHRRPILLDGVPGQGPGGRSCLLQGPRRLREPGPGDPGGIPYKVLRRGRPRAGLLKIPIESVRPELAVVRAGGGPRRPRSDEWFRWAARWCWRRVPTSATARWRSWPTPGAPRWPCRSGPFSPGGGESHEAPYFHASGPLSSSPWAWPSSPQVARWWPASASGTDTRTAGAATAVPTGGWYGGPVYP